VNKPNFAASDVTMTPFETATITAARQRMPAEWSAHERTLMAWPARHALWAAELDRAKAEYAAVARTIARFEPVLVIANPEDAQEAAKCCGQGVEVVDLPINDSWIRDSGAIIVREPSGRRVGVHFKFNAYGERFTPYVRDARIGELVLDHLKIPVRESKLVLEGGSITVDGEGTLIATEQCLLNENRNPSWTRQEIEQELRAQFGVEQIVWLRWGRLEDLHTDGHVDVVCMFAGPGVVIAQGCADRSNPNYTRLQANLRALRSAIDAQGRPLHVIELPIQPLVDVGGHATLVSNNNFYFVNGGVIVPVADEETGDGVLEIFRRALPGREVVGVAARAVGFGGGGIHCITQQIPAAS